MKPKPLTAWTLARQLLRYPPNTLVCVTATDSFFPQTATRVLRTPNDDEYRTQYVEGRKPNRGIVVIS